MSVMRRVATGWAIILCSSLIILAITASLLFTLAMFWGGIQILFGTHVLPVTKPWVALLIALSSALLYELASRRHRTRDGQINPTHAEKGQQHRFWMTAATVSIMVLAALWMTVYRAHGASSLVSLPPMLVLHLAAVLGGIGFYIAFARWGAPTAGSIGTGLWIFSPMLVPVSWPSTIAYACIAALIFGLPKDKITNWHWTKVRWITACGLGVLLMSISVWLGHGWASGRFIRRIALLTNEWLWAIPLACGLVFMVRENRTQLSRIARASLYFLLPAMGLMGARGTWGDAGLALVIPCFAVVFGSGVVFAAHWLQSHRLVFLRNIAFLSLMGAALGWVRHAPVSPIHETASNQKPLAYVFFHDQHLEAAGTQKERL